MEGSIFVPGSKQELIKGRLYTFQCSGFFIMGKDPAFLFYPGDWQGGTMYMTHEQKGAYMDLLILQFNVGKFTKAQAKQVLSICFDVAWPMLEQKFSTDGKFFWNQRLSAEIEKRQKFTESRRNNAKGHKTPKASAKHMHKHMENENENEILTEYENWTDAILNRLDQHFEQMLMKESIPESPAVEHWVRDHLGLLNRYPKMRPTSQDAFRKSCMKHLRENYKKPITSNGTTRKEQDTKAAIAHVAAHYGAAEKR
jgi:uncharacterized protein YdaU (DUF1376 family)